MPDVALPALAGRWGAPSRGKVLEVPVEVAVTAVLEAVVETALRDAREAEPGFALLTALLRAAPWPVSFCRRSLLTFRPLACQHPG